MDDAALFLLIGIAFPICFVGIWCMVLAIISIVSGWHELARNYKAEDTPDNLSWKTGLTARMRLVDARSTFCLAMTEKGLYIRLGPAFLFSFMHPTLMIPWKSMESLGSKNVLIFKYKGFKIDGVEIWVMGDGMDGAAKFHPGFES